MTSSGARPDTRIGDATAGQSATRTRALLALAALLLLGAALRLYDLGGRSIQEDEAYHAVVSSGWARTGSPLPPSGEPYKRGLPLIYLETLSVRHLPFQFETCVRLPVALLGILNIGLLVLLGRKCGGLRFGLVAGLVFAVSPWAVHWARTARMYELLLTATLLTFLAYGRVVRKPRWSNLAWLAAAMLFALSAHSLGVFLALLPLCGIVLHLNRLRVGLILAAAFAFLVICWKAYPAALKALIPPALAEDLGAGSSSGLALPDLRAMGLAWSHAPWLWSLGALVLVLIPVAVTLRRGGPAAFPVLPWLLGILLAGVTGLLMAGTVVLAAFVVLSGYWGGTPRSVTRQRWWLLGAHAATWLFWGALAVVICIDQGELQLREIARTASYAARYPDLLRSVCAPLLRSALTLAPFVVGTLGLVLVLARVFLEGPLVPRRKPLTTYLLFLLATIATIGIAASFYKTGRYFYFLLPAVLLSFLEVMWALVSTWPRRARLSALGAGVLFLALVQFPSALQGVAGTAETIRTSSAFGLLPDFGLGQRLRSGRVWRGLDYRAAGEVLRERMQPGDLLLADAAHQFQVYVSRIDGHLSPPLREYARKNRHYLTGSELLRTPEALVAFLQDKQDRTAWIALTGYNSVWTELLPHLLSAHRVWVSGEIALYSLSGEELLSSLVDGERQEPAL